MSDNLQRGGSRRQGKTILMDWSLLNDMVLEERVVCLTSRQIAALMGITEFLRWGKRWESLTATPSELDQFATDIEVRLMEICPVDCNDVLDCIESSVLTNEPLPPLPTGIDENTCRAAVYIVDKLISEVAAGLEANASSTLPAWLDFILSKGGYILESLVFLWDVLALLGTPEDVAADLATDRDELIALVYCADLNITAIIAAINASTTLTATSVDAIIPVLESITQATLHLWASIGVVTQDVSEACDCEEEPTCPVYDFTVDNGEWVIDTGTFNHPGLYVASTGWEGDLSPLGGSGQNTVIHIKKVYPEPFFVTSIKMIYTLTKGQFSSPQTDVSVNVQGYLAGVLQHTNAPLSYASAVNGAGQERVQAVGTEIDEIRLLVRAARFITNPNPLGYALITGLEVTC